MENHRVYEKVKYNGEFYVIVDPLETKYCFDFEF